MPPTVKEVMKHGPPRSPKLREQTISARHNVAPSMYTLHAGVIFTGLPCPSGIAQREAPTFSATPPCVAPLPEPAATPLPNESGHQLHQCRRKERRNLRTAQALVRATVVSR